MNRGRLPGVTVTATEISTGFSRSWSRSRTAARLEPAARPYKVRITRLRHHNPAWNFSSAAPRCRHRDEI
jgi:hypothetical protein